MNKLGLKCGWLLWTFAASALQLQAASTLQFAAYTFDVREEAGPAVVTVTRTGDMDTLVSVDYLTRNQTATAGLDYTNVAGRLTFAAGETNKTINIPILNDALVESTETFQVYLANASDGALLGAPTTATVRILDNDNGLAFEFGKYSVREDEGSVLIGVMRGDDGNFSATVEYATTDVTAKAREDYTATAGKLAFAAGEKLKLFSIPILNDGLKEGNETFMLTLTNATGATLGTQRIATVTIVDNDPGVQFEFNSYWMQESERTLTMRVLRGNDGVLDAFTVDYATGDQTARAGQDYTETKGTLAFGVGEMVQTLRIPITLDALAETDETFTMTLSNLTGTVTLGPIKTATVTILDSTGMTAHRFAGIAMLPGGSIRLTLGGSVHSRFLDYFDLYPLEVSTNLVDWKPLVTLQRTNSYNRTFTYTDAEAVTSGRRFYRMVTNHLITPVNQPTGPFSVGMTSRLVTDPTRRNRYGVSTNGSFMVSIWYPAVAEAGKLPGRYQDLPLAQDGAFWGSARIADPEACFVSCALPDARCAAAQAPYPIVIYSHGWGDVRFEVAGRAPHLASYGYVVVAIDHFDAFGTVFPDGTYLHGDGSTATLAGTQDRIRDVQVVLDELSRWNDGDPILASRLDLDHIATMGFSWGAESAGEAARTDARCKAAILLDEGFSFVPELVRLGLQKPLLLINAQYGDESLALKNSRDAISFWITSIVHLELTDYCWITDPSDLRNGREAARTVNDYSLWFLNKYLKGINDPIPPPSNYRLIINFKQK